MNVFIGLAWRGRGVSGFVEEGERVWYARYVPTYLISIPHIQ